MWRVSRVFLVGILGAAFAVPIQSSTLSRAQASSYSCNSYTDFYLGAGSYNHIPTLGRNSGELNCVLGVGNQGIAVTKLQEALRWCNGQNIAVDGIYGRHTAQAVRNVQNGRVAVDGVYGPDTERVITWPVHHIDGRIDCTPPD
jgi:hypothetical protein